MQCYFETFDIKSYQLWEKKAERKQSTAKLVLEPHRRLSPISAVGVSNTYLLTKEQVPRVHSIQSLSLSAQSILLGTDHHFHLAITRGADKACESQRRVFARAFKANNTNVPLSPTPPCLTIPCNHDAASNTNATSNFQPERLQPWHPPKATRSTTSRKRPRSSSSLTQRTAVRLSQEATSSETSTRCHHG